MYIHIITWGINMAVTYKKLFKLLIDRKMKKKELCEQAKASTATVSKLANDENVTVEILARICTALNSNLYN